MNQFKKAFKGIDSAIQQGTARALNRALSSTKAQISKTIRNEVGLTNKQIAARIREIKAGSKSLAVKLAIATKVGISLTEFKPQVKAVNVVHAGNRKATKHYGVTVKLGTAGRLLVPGGFLATVKSGKQLVLSRKGKGRYPTVALRTTLFSDVVTREQTATQKYLLDTFNELVGDYIEYEIGKSFLTTK